MPRIPARHRALALALALLAVTGACTRSEEKGPGISAKPSGPVTERPLAAGVDYRESVHRGPAGPVRVSVLRIAPDAAARLVGAHGASMALPQTVRQAARRAGALAAVNGSYFDIKGGKAYSGYPGDPVGLYVEGGRVLSEARDDGAALLLGHRDGRLWARITEVATPGLITAADGETRRLDGVDRAAGRLRPCRGTDHDRLAAEGRVWRQDPGTGLCEDPDEIVEFTPDWGVATPDGPRGSVEAVLDGDGAVSRLRSPAGGPVPKDGRALYGIGEGADWLREHVRRGTAPDVSIPLTDSSGEDLTGFVDTAVGGGRRLLSGGRVVLSERDRAATDRPPRTLAGVTADGSVLLVTVDGRDPGASEGATLAESAGLLSSLGAVDGLNLDGGGSTTMVVGGELRNRPREAVGDPVGERKVATVLAVLPR
ncbi:phosphodiester glycosidase family protein [Streptomyces bikiniensis]|uniref:phosphodiester glycosidase family protein n=1 Tax=Streptomyces bikiniensis TaxID=1896 RepID=UPI0009986424|nr:phosphodiester glycosidase family protein [Streptomyces bikiniensis]